MSLNFLDTTCAEQERFDLIFGFPLNSYRLGKLINS
jgi:hypothetical protein